MKKRILLIACFLILSVVQLNLISLDCFYDRKRNFQVFAEKTTEKPKDTELEALIDSISELAAKVLEIFGRKRKKFISVFLSWNFFFPEPIAAKANNSSSDIDPDNTYFVSFLLRDRRNKTQNHEHDEAGLQRMTVNNNFSGDKMGNSQVFMESGPPPKQPPAHNIQLLSSQSDPLPHYQSPHSPYQQHPYPLYQQHRYG